jgi:hypothetical protein
MNIEPNVIYASLYLRLFIALESAMILRFSGHFYAFVRRKNRALRNMKFMRHLW